MDFGVVPKCLRLRGLIQGMELVTLIETTKVLGIRHTGQTYWESQQPVGSTIGPLMIQQKCWSDLSLKCPELSYWPVSML